MHALWKVMKQTARIPVLLLQLVLHEMTLPRRVVLPLLGILRLWASLRNACVQYVKRHLVVRCVFAKQAG